MTERIREQILAVRATGRTNMFDVPMVQYIANEMRFYAQFTRLPMVDFGTPLFI